MPISKLHEERKKKNYLVLAVIIAWVVVLAVVTVLKMQAGQ